MMITHSSDFGFPSNTRLNPQMHRLHLQPSAKIVRDYLAMALQLIPFKAHQAYILFGC